MVSPQGNPSARFYAAPAADNQTAPAETNQTAPAATYQTALAPMYQTALAPMYRADAAPTYPAAQTPTYPAAPVTTHQAALAPMYQAASAPTNPAAPAATYQAAAYTAHPVGQSGHAGSLHAAPTGPAYRPPPCGFDQQAVKQYMQNMGATRQYQFCMGCGQAADFEHRRNFQDCPGPCWRCLQSHPGTVCPTWDNWHSRSWWSRHLGRHPDHMHQPGGLLEHIRSTEGRPDQEQALAQTQRALGNIAREVGTLRRVQSGRIDRRSNQDARSRSARQPQARDRS